MDATSSRCVRKDSGPQIEVALDDGVGSPATAQKNEGLLRVVPVDRRSNVGSGRVVEVETGRGSINTLERSISYENESAELLLDRRSWCTDLCQWPKLNRIHLLRCTIIGLMILTSQTLLQTWYAVAPSQFQSSILLGFSNGFGDTFDLITAVILGRLPHRRLRVHLSLLSIGLFGTATTIYCYQYQLVASDYVIFFGFCTLGISTCFQPILMLCNVNEPHLTQWNSLVFAVFKQLSWASTWAISAGLYNSKGFLAVLIDTCVMLVFLALLAMISDLVDPFKKSSMSTTTKCSSENNSEHGPESPQEPVVDSAQGVVLRNPVVSTLEEPVSGSSVEFGHHVIVMLITGAFTFEAAVHSTALELLLQNQFHLSESRSIDYFCMIPCVAAAVFASFVLICRCCCRSSQSWHAQDVNTYQKLRLKRLVAVSLAVLAITNWFLPFLPSVPIVITCAVITVTARTALLSSMSPYVDVCSRSKATQAKLMMVQNMSYNATWSLASVLSGYLCIDYIQWTFVSAAVFEGLLFLVCVVVL